MLSDQSSSAGSRRPPRRSDAPSIRKTVYTHRPTCDLPPSPSRVVIAGGSEFVLQPVPTRSSPSSSRLSSTSSHVSAPHLSASASAPEPQPQSPLQYRAVSASITPPRFRQADRPYRPPPSSSARFYQRQQQLWGLPQPNPLSPALATYATSSSLFSPEPATHRFSAHYHLPTSSLQSPQPSSPAYNHAASSEPVSNPVRSPSSSLASTSTRPRATSVSSLAPPEPREVNNRARSGSNASSFTRSRFSNGYHSHTDDDSVDHDPFLSSSTQSPDQPEARSHAFGAASMAHPDRHRLPPDSTTERSPSRSQAATAHQQASSGDTLGDSGDADWDAELGISETGHAEPLRLPKLSHSDHVLCASPSIISHSSSAKPNTHSSKFLCSATATPLQPESHLESIHTAELKGIRVTSTVSESWDDDFLFQNEEHSVESTPLNSSTAQRQPKCEHNSLNIASSSKLLHLHAKQDGHDSDDVENWDDAFSWNAYPLLTSYATPTSSQLSSSFLSSVPSGHMQDRDAHEDRTSFMELPPDFPRHSDFRGGMHSPNLSRKRFSNASSASDATDFSARLAAQQSDVDLYHPRISQDSDRVSALSSPQSSRGCNTLGLISTGRKAARDMVGRDDRSGDETETETPSREPIAPIKSRSARRSLGAALGFDTHQKTMSSRSTASLQSPSRIGGKKKPDTDATGVKSHATSQSKPKLGAFQRLSFSRSRVSVASASSTCVNEIAEACQGSQRVYADNLNRSHASLLSQMSTASNRSGRGASPSSLERSYAALRSTSLLRLLRRGEKNTAVISSGAGSPATPPFSPPRRRSELSNPLEIMGSPPRDRPCTQDSNQSMSPPSTWLRLRRSIEVTPTHSKDRIVRRGSDSLHFDSPSHASWAVPGSPGKPLTSLKGADNWGDTTTGASDESHFHGCRQSGGSSSSKELSNSPRRLGYPSTAGLRRDFSSSNTLRADLSNGFEDRPAGLVPARSGREGSCSDASARSVQAVHREGNGRIGSDGASADGAAMLYPYLGEKVLRGSDDRALANRLVSASTTHSQTSTESQYGYRMRKHISASSGPDAHDSETSYGTSVGSSPGLSNMSSSGWLFYGKRGATSSMDTRDTAWTASTDLPGRNDQSTVQDDHHGRAASMPGSPLCLEKTLDGAPAVALYPPRKQSAPDASLYQAQYASSNISDLSFADLPLQASHGSASRTLESSTIKPLGSTAGTNVPILPSTGQAASPHKSATRRNSLSDLKIPTRISKAQTGIRNNMILVRDFAKGIEELKKLKASYMDHKMNASLRTPDVEERVHNWLECADVLIGLGEGRTESDSAARVDTLSHTPLPARFDSRRTTFSDVSSYASPTSPLEFSISRQVSVSGSRSTSGTSQGTASTTDGARSVDAQREIDILSALLGGTRLSPTPRTESRSHGRFQSETFTRDDVPHKNVEYATRPSKTFAAVSSTELSTVRSNLTTPDRDSIDARRGGKAVHAKHSERPFNTAPGMSGGNAGVEGVARFEGVDVGDANRSAKRRLRSASRAGIQGLRELLKVFKGSAGDDSAACLKTAGSSEIVRLHLSAREQARCSMDAGALTPPTSKQKRKSLNLKRRSFLRSKTSLESIQVKDSDAVCMQQATPPMPNVAESGRQGLSASKSERRKQGLWQTDCLLETTWESGCALRSQNGGQAKETSASTTKSGRRISLGNSKRGSVDEVRAGLGSTKLSDALQHDTDSRWTKHDAVACCQQGGCASVGVQTAKNAEFTPDARRASSSVDSMHQRRVAATRSQSSMETPKLEVPMVQKLALRPEAMPGLLVYVQATKQHLEAAIDELRPCIPSPV